MATASLSKLDIVPLGRDLGMNNLAKGAES